MTDAAEQWMLAYSRHLRDHRIRLTSQRRIIADGLAKSPGREFTVEELIGELQGSDIGRATIYRALLELSQASLLSERYANGQQIYRVDPA